MSLNLIITNAGRAALINAANDGTNAVRIASAGLSSTAVVPTAGATMLPGEIKRVATLNGAAIAKDVIHLVIRDESSGVYSLRSFGLYLGDGTLFAIYGQADPILEKSASAMLLLAVDATFVDVSAAQISFGGTGFLNPPATNDQAGVVKLATNAQTLALTDPKLSLSPANLGAVIASNMVLADRGELPAAQLDTATANGIYSIAQSYYVDTLMSLTRPSSTGTVQLLFGYQGVLSWRNRQDNLQWGAFNTIWHSASDGAGSGLDADMLDGYHLSQVLSDRGLIPESALDAAVANGFYSVVRGTFADSMLTFTQPSSTGTVQLLFSYQGGMAWRNRRDNLQWTPFNTVWLSTNDGAGSGLDADLLDGRHGSDYASAAHTHSAAQISAVFAGSLGLNGYQVLQNGLILQWATGALMSAGQEATQLVYFPIVFPNACFGAVVSTQDDAFSAASNAMFSSVFAPTRDQVTVARKQFSDAGQDLVASRPFVIALGR
jgi:hypothetical protein